LLVLILFNLRPHLLQLIHNLPELIATGVPHLPVLVALSFQLRNLFVQPLDVDVLLVAGLQCILRQNVTGDCVVDEFILLFSLREV